MKCLYSVKYFIFNIMVWEKYASNVGMLIKGKLCWYCSYTLNIHIYIMEDLFDEFITGETIHTYTRGGNMRAPLMTQLCDMVATARPGITTEMIIKNFKVCGQSSECQVSDILAFKDSKTYCEGIDNLESMEFRYVKD